MNFIGVYENSIPENLCIDLLESFNTVKNTVGTVIENNHSVGREDTSFRLNDFDVTLNSALNTGLSMAMDKYREEYPMLMPCSLKSYNIKMQETEIGGGYHDWHFESSHIDVSSRLLFWLLYLNDVEEGGETEFLYQKVRFKPKARTMIIAPSSFTHTHRGNPPLSNTKYVATGWYNLF